MLKNGQFQEDRGRHWTSDQELFSALQHRAYCRVSEYHVIGLVDLALLHGITAGHSFLSRLLAMCWRTRHSYQWGHQDCMIALAGN